jgi:hypothetical protein
LYEVSNGFNRKIERWRRGHGGFMDSYARFREGEPSSIIKAIIEGHSSRQPLCWEQMFFVSEPSFRLNPLPQMLISLV